jgi:hypothetical protein
VYRYRAAWNYDLGDKGALLCRQSRRENSLDHPANVLNPDKAWRLPNASDIVDTIKS